jgi:hypothetical protein
MSAVTVIGAAGSMEVVLSSDDPTVFVDRLVRVLESEADVGQATGGRGRQAVILLPPERAQFLHEHGWDRHRLAAEIIRRCEQRTLSPRIGVEAATQRDVVGRHDDVLIGVAGGTGIKATVVPSWSGATRAVTRVVEAV